MSIIEEIVCEERQEGDTEVIILSDEAFDRLTAILEEKSEPSPALVELMKRRKRWATQ